MNSTFEPFCGIIARFGRYLPSISKGDMEFIYKILAAELIYKILAVIGGVGVISMGLLKFAGGIFRDRLKEQHRKSSEIEIERVRQRFELRRAQVDKFAQSQFDIYLEIWGTLSELELAVNTLWHTVTEQNIATLLRQLRTTKQKVKANSILFEKQHLDELERLFAIIENFTTGKLSLAEIRSKKDLDYIKVEEIKTQIEENYQYKDQLKRLLEDLERSFRTSLSSLDVT